MPLGANKAAIMGVSGVSTAASVVLLNTLTATSSTTLSFTSGIDSTYGEYIFKWYNVNPETDNAFFQFQANATDSTSYDEYITSAVFIAFANEADSDTNFTYVHDAGTDYDQAQGQAYQQLCTIGNGADESAVGELHLFNPASTTYVKHFYSTAGTTHGSDYTRSMRVGGYFNTTTAIDDIQFKMSAGDWDGKIKMWGVL